MIFKPGWTFMTPKKGERRDDDSGFQGLPEKAVIRLSGTKPSILCGVVMRAAVIPSRKDGEGPPNNNMVTLPWEETWTAVARSLGVLRQPRDDTLFLLCGGERK